MLMRNDSDLSEECRRHQGGFAANGGDGVRRSPLLWQKRLCHTPESQDAPQSEETHLASPGALKTRLHLFSRAEPHAPIGCSAAAVGSGTQTHGRSRVRCPFSISHQVPAWSRKHRGAAGSRRLPSSVSARIIYGASFPFFLPPTGDAT